MKKWTTAALLALLAAAATAEENKVQLMLMAMSDEEVAQELGRMLTASGNPCMATDTFFHGTDGDNTANWNVACSNGQSYNVQIATDASTRIMPCDIMRTIGVPCWQKFE